MEEGRLRTTPEAFRRRFASERPPMRIAIEAGTHSPWVSRCSRSAATRSWWPMPARLRLIYANKRKTDEVDAENLARLAAWIRSYSTHSSTGAKTPRPIWP